MKESVENFLKEVEANEELRAKIEVLAGADDMVEKIIAIAAEYGYTLTAEDLELEEAEKLSLDDLDSAAGGRVYNPFLNDPVSHLTRVLRAKGRIR